MGNIIFGGGCIKLNFLPLVDVCESGCFPRAGTWLLALYGMISPATLGWLRNVSFESNGASLDWQIAMHEYMKDIHAIVNITLGVVGFGVFITTNFTPKQSILLVELFVIAFLLYTITHFIYHIIFIYLCVYAVRITNCIGLEEILSNVHSVICYFIVFMLLVSHADAACVINAYRVELETIHRERLRHQELILRRPNAKIEDREESVKPTTSTQDT